MAGMLSSYLAIIGVYSSLLMCSKIFKTSFYLSLGGESSFVPYGVGVVQFTSFKRPPEIHKRRPLCCLIFSGANYPIVTWKFRGIDCF